MAHTRALSCLSAAPLKGQLYMGFLFLPVVPWAEARELARVLSFLFRRYHTISYLPACLQHIGLLYSPFA